ncbi:MAG: hypothetical protein IT165_15905 [Bryobacterales bacterium]|nr:hypothetical protein [Bryobacterales bacterium]
MSGGGSPKRQLNREGMLTRYHELVDRKFLVGLSPSELQELDSLNTSLDTLEDHEPFEQILTAMDWDRQVLHASISEILLLVRQQMK